MIKRYEKGEQIGGRRTKKLWEGKELVGKGGREEGGAWWPFDEGKRWHSWYGYAYAAKRMHSSGRNQFQKRLGCHMAVRKT